ncbi:cytoplasmic protein [Actinomadura sp. CNU-125]|uniref:STM4015 family protein n=1 Tax=Actinomadura sp. CNU-125 TaxID=1904961 RepID=UPI0009630B80|nr:STM4015 family protein [Actinomadura sp. CNU-125]OLT25105.1 cytoplasmic protein [Actinomadura sp. CNU-125]
MGIWDEREEYAGLPVFRFDQERLGADAADLPDLPAAGAAAWRVTSDFDEERFDDVWEMFRASVDTTEVTALLIGYWGESDDVTYPALLLAEAAASFPKLDSLFFGEITAGESEISWIVHGDISPIVRAFPGLRRLDVRGSDGLVFEPFESDALEVLRFESGGLPASTVRTVAACGLPNLRRLDLWIGVNAYGGDVSMDDLAPVLSGERFPSLRHLGLENAEWQDEIAAAVAAAPVVARLESLGLARGMLTDTGAEALLSGQPLTHLRRLDLHHHFLSDAMMARLRNALPGVEIDLGDQGDPEGAYFYVQVAE